jgi:LmbE family N-acetylglucosaminyl deacetylase
MVLSYETVSETHWAAPGIEPTFAPQYYVDITEHLEAKCNALRTYETQLRPEPAARSVGAIAALAKWRGSTVGVPAAEAFMIIRGLYG